MKNIKGKKGAQMTGGVVVLIILGLVAAYMFIPAVQQIFQPTESVSDGVSLGRCPSSGLTEVTLNAQEALATSATNSNVSYYVYDNGALVKTGITGSDGTVTFDLGCQAGKTYQMLTLNEISSAAGIYPITTIIDASDSQETINLKTYEYGQVDLANLGSSVDPAQSYQVAAGTGKTCGFVVTMTSNESAAAINRPIIICEANSSAVVKIHMSGLTAVQSKIPDRLSGTAGKKMWAFEYDKLFKSTDAAVKVSGQIEFTGSTTINSEDNMSCIIVDQATWKRADYQSLSLSEGFVVDSAENTETISDIGAPDSEAFDLTRLAFNGTSYC